MKTNRSKTLVALFTLAGALLSATVQAQPPGGFGGPPPGGGGFPPPGSGGGFGMGRQRKPSLAMMPVEFLTNGLNLTSAQQTKINQIQQKMREQRRSMMPPPPQQGGQFGRPEGPPPQGQPGGNRDKMQAMERQTVQQIEAVLTAEQKKQVPGLIAELETLRSAGLPPALSGKLKLTVEQKKKIAGLHSAKPQPQKQNASMEQARKSGKFGATWEAGRGDGMDAPQDRQKTLAILTPEQRKAVADFEKAHPRPQGGRGFGGPPPFGGPNGAPPQGRGQR